MRFHSFQSGNPGFCRIKETEPDMGIYLLSLSHKTTPLEVRSLFAYSEETKEQVLEGLLASGWIDEAVVLSTCNRMEIYCHAPDGGKEPAMQALKAMEQEAVKAAKAEAEEDMGRYFRRYHGRQAVHHLFQVAAGLDSMVIGEDQILGQVKQAYDFSHERGYCKSYLNTLFRDAVTGAKKVKTDTGLSKTPVSTAGLAIRAAEERLGGLGGKKLMILGATGRIGSIVLKNVQQIPELEIYVTTRSRTSLEKLGHGLRYQAVPYEERYSWLDGMDVVVSATASPHYTLTAHGLRQHLKTDKERVFLDLAVPQDIEKLSVPGFWYYNIEDMAELARQNNERKLAEVPLAGRIIEEYENQYYKWLLYRDSQNLMEEWKSIILRDISEKGAEAAVSRLLYQFREAGTVEEVEHFLAMLDKVKEEERKAARQRPSSPKKKQPSEAKAYFPLFFDLKYRKVLVAGAGKIAARRAEALAEFGAEIQVVAPSGIGQMERLAAQGMVHWEKRCFVPEDVSGCNMVIAATDDARVNREIVRCCRERQIPVNHAGDKSQCDFYFPGVAREGNLVVGVTASGKDHKLASEVTGRLQSWLKQLVQG